MMHIGCSISIRLRGNLNDVKLKAKILFKSVMHILLADVNSLTYTYLYLINYFDRILKFTKALFPPPLSMITFAPSPPVSLITMLERLPDKLSISIT